MNVVYTVQYYLSIYLVTAIERDLLSVRDDSGVNVSKVRLPICLHSD